MTPSASPASLGRLFGLALLSSAGLGIMLTVIGFNFLGNGLRDAMDPRLKNV